eukprot:COSAG04_NODE_3483_length_2787_cov_121.267910_3_plen_156_part_00
MKALHPWTPAQGAHSTHLTFEVGQVIEAVADIFFEDPTFGVMAEGQCNGRRGLFPHRCIKQKLLTPAGGAAAVATYVAVGAAVGGPVGVLVGLAAGRAVGKSVDRSGGREFGVDWLGEQKGGARGPGGASGSQEATSLQALQARRQLGRKGRKGR